MFELTDEEFVAAIEAALTTIPERFLNDLENVQIVAEDESDPAREGYTGVGGLAELGQPSDAQHHVVRSGGEILGLYSGTPLTSRGAGYGAVGTQPDTITIYKRPHERCFFTHGDIVEQIRKTVIHEVGHYFGMDEAQVRAMGY